MLRFEIVIRSCFACALLATFGLGSGVVQAQARASVISVDEGKRVRSIARLDEGRWIADGTCTAGKRNAQTSDRERLIVTGEVKVFQVRAVVPGSPEWQRLVPTIVDLFERREREQRLASDRTSEAPRAVDWLFTAADGHRRTYYFEASRRVASASADVDHDVDPPGTLRVAVAGFLDESSGRLIPLGTKSELRWEQDGLPAGPGRPDLTPLGVVAQGLRSIWVMKGQSGTNARFTLYDVSTGGTRTLLTVPAGRC